jgi:hypothetical protein
VLLQEHQLPAQRACPVVRLSRTAYYQPPVPASRRDAAVIAALTEAVTRHRRSCQLDAEAYAWRPALFLGFHDTFVDRSRLNRNAAWRKNQGSVGERMTAASFMSFGLFIIYATLAK